MLRDCALIRGTYHLRTGFKGCGSQSLTCTHSTKHTHSTAGNRFGGRQKTKGAGTAGQSASATSHLVSGPEQVVSPRTGQLSRSATARRHFYSRPWPLVATAAGSACDIVSPTGKPGSGLPKHCRWGPGDGSGVCPATKVPPCWAPRHHGLSVRPPRRPVQGR